MNFWDSLINCTWLSSAIVATITTLLITRYFASIDAIRNQLAFQIAFLQTMKYFIEKDVSLLKMTVSEECKLPLDKLAAYLSKDPSFEQMSAFGQMDALTSDIIATYCNVLMSIRVCISCNAKHKKNGLQKMLRLGEKLMAVIDAQIRIYRRVLKSNALLLPFVAPRTNNKLYEDCADPCDATDNTTHCDSHPLPEKGTLWESPATNKTSYY